MGEAFAEWLRATEAVGRPYVSKAVNWQELRAACETQFDQWMAGHPGAKPRQFYDTCVVLESNRKYDDLASDEDEDFVEVRPFPFFDELRFFPFDDFTPPMEARVAELTQAMNKTPRLLAVLALMARRLVGIVAARTESELRGCNRDTAADYFSNMFQMTLAAEAFFPTSERAFDIVSDLRVGMPGRPTSKRGDAQQLFDEYTAVADPVIEAAGAQMWDSMSQHARGGKVAWPTDEYTLASPMEISRRRFFAAVTRGIRSRDAHQTNTELRFTPGLREKTLRIVERRARWIKVDIEGKVHLAFAYTSRGVPGGRKPRHGDDDYDSAISDEYYRMSNATTTEDRFIIPDFGAALNLTDRLNTPIFTALYNKWPTYSFTQVSLNPDAASSSSPAVMTQQQSLRKVASFADWISDTKAFGRPYVTKAVHWQELRAECEAQFNEWADENHGRATERFYEEYVVLETDSGNYPSDDESEDEDEEAVDVRPFPVFSRLKFGSLMHATTAMWDQSKAVGARMRQRPRMKAVLALMARKLMGVVGARTGSELESCNRVTAARYFNNMFHMVLLAETFFPGEPRAFDIVSDIRVGMPVRSTSKKGNGDAMLNSYIAVARSAIHNAAAETWDSMSQHAWGGKVKWPTTEYTIKSPMAFALNRFYAAVIRNIRCRVAHEAKVQLEVTPSWGKRLLAVIVERTTQWIRVRIDGRLHVAFGYTSWIEPGRTQPKEPADDDEYDSAIPAEYDEDDDDAKTERRFVIPDLGKVLDLLSTRNIALLDDVSERQELDDLGGPFAGRRPADYELPEADQSLLQDPGYQAHLAEVKRLTAAADQGRKEAAERERRLQKTREEEEARHIEEHRQRLAEEERKRQQRLEARRAREKPPAAAAPPAKAARAASSATSTDTQRQRDREARLHAEARAAAEESRRQIAALQETAKPKEVAAAKRPTRKAAADASKRIREQVQEPVPPQRATRASTRRRVEERPRTVIVIDDDDDDPAPRVPVPVQAVVPMEEEVQGSDDAETASQTSERPIGTRRNRTVLEDEKVAAPAQKDQRTAAQEAWQKQIKELEERQQRQREQEEYRRGRAEEQRRIAAVREQRAKEAVEAMAKADRERAEKEKVERERVETEKAERQREFERQQAELHRANERAAAAREEEGRRKREEAAAREMEVQRAAEQRARRAAEHEAAAREELQRQRMVREREEHERRQREERVNAEMADALRRLQFARRQFAPVADDDKTEDDGEQDV